MGTYTLFQADGKDVAGMMNPLTDFSKGRPPFWAAYIEVVDVDASAVKAVQLGGKLIETPGDVPDVGRVCMITDPSGAPICLMTPASPTSQ